MAGGITITELWSALRTESIALSFIEGNEGNEDSHIFVYPLVNFDDLLFKLQEDWVSLIVSSSFIT